MSESFRACFEKVAQATEPLPLNSAGRGWRSRCLLPFLLEERVGERRGVVFGNSPLPSPLPGRASRGEEEEPRSPETFIQGQWATGLGRPATRRTERRGRSPIASFASRFRAFLLYRFLVATVPLALATLVQAAEVLPPAPARYFNDYAHLVSAPAVERLDRQLEDFEKATSSQIVVAIFPKMESPSSIEDYVHRMFVTWKIGQKGRNNGVLLAVFVNDRKLRIEVGYGLEGALPDALGRRIIDNEITPHFKRADYDAGLAAGVNAILAATKGEYKGTGPTAGGKPSGFGWILRTLIFNALFPWHLVVGFTILSALWSLIFGRRGRRGTLYDRSGARRYDSGWGWFGGGSGGGGGWSGGGGGGFSGGGGDSGGGGASGSW